MLLPAELILADRAEKRAGGTGFLLLAASPFPALASPIRRPPALRSVPKQFCPDPSEGLPDAKILRR